MVRSKSNLHKLSFKIDNTNLAIAVDRRMMMIPAGVFRFPNIKLMLIRKSGFRKSLKKSESADESKRESIADNGRWLDRQVIGDGGGEFY